MREEKLSQCERETEAVEIILLFLGFTFGANSISEEVAGFSPLWFPQGKTCVHCLLCLIFVLVILLVNDPNIMLA